MAGASYQGVFRNPLADPYLLGAGAGAGLAVTIVIAATSAAPGGGDQIVPLAALRRRARSGAAWRTRSGGGPGGSRSPPASLRASRWRLPHRGADVRAAAELGQLREVYTWILGRLTVARWRDVLWSCPTSRWRPSCCLLHRRVLDVLAVGESEASTLGHPDRPHSAHHRRGGVARDGGRSRGGRPDRVRRHHRPACDPARGRPELPADPAAVACSSAARSWCSPTSRARTDHRAGRAADRRRDGVRRCAVLPARAAAVDEDGARVTAALASVASPSSSAGTASLDHVDLDVPAGHWTSVVGPNGAGKTTLLNALGGDGPAHVGDHRAPRARTRGS